MLAFLKRFGSALLTLFLALAWMWGFILKDLNIIGDTQRLWIVAIFTGVLAAQQAYLAFPRPVNRGTVEAQRPVIESYLAAVLRRYYQQLLTLAPGLEGSPPCVRVNVMLPTRRFRIGASYLKIYHTACPPNITYYDDELSEKWKKDQGTCGWTWNQKTLSIYDSKHEKRSLPADRLTASQRRATSHLNSTLSIPIWNKDDRIVGVLNMDSEQNTDESFLAHNEIIDSAEACAQHLAAHCFSNGVKS